MSFATTDAAWFWTMSALLARRNGDPITPAPDPSIDPDDVVRALDTLYRRRRINLNHARILRMYGERGTPPERGCANHRTWLEALNALDPSLRHLGIVA